MKYIAQRTEDGTNRGKITFYCRVLKVSRQGFYQHLANRDRPWKYQALAEVMREIVAEDTCNDPYGRTRMRQALELKAPEGVDIPSERTVYRVMESLGLSHHPKRKPNGITKADQEARKSDDLLKRDFSAEKPLEKCVTDITEIKAKDGKLYVSAIFDCFDLAVLGLAMETNMRAELCSVPGKRCGSLSRPGGRYNPQRPGLPIHKRRLPSGYRTIRYLPEHEQCWRPLPRQRPLREHVGPDEERTAL